jgi:hypothetical protein
MKKIRSVRIEYTVRPDVDLDELTGAIAEFVAGIRAHNSEHRYTSYQQSEDHRSFVHIAELVEEVVPALQAEPFFSRFTSFLRQRCAKGPDVTELARVASAR